MKKIAVYPGTFDPVTNGHSDLVFRAARMFDRIILAVADNPSKRPLFSLAERIDLAAKALGGAGDGGGDGAGDGDVAGDGAGDVAGDGVGDGAGDVAGGDGDVAGNIEVVGFSGLLIDFAEQRGAEVILRGLRAVSDFEYEFQLASMNRRLQPKLETVFLAPAEQYTFVSASLVKEIATHGGDVSAFVHHETLRALSKKFRQPPLNRTRG